MWLVHLLLICSLHQFQWAIAKCPPEPPGAFFQDCLHSWLVNELYDYAPCSPSAFVASARKQQREVALPTNQDEREMLLRFYNLLNDFEKDMGIQYIYDNTTAIKTDWFYLTPDACFTRFAPSSKIGRYLKSKASGSRPISPVYAYTVIQDPPFTTWKAALMQCQKIHATLPIFRHGNDEDPGIDLAYFTVLQSVFEEYSSFGALEELRKDDRLQNVHYGTERQKMAELWKFCIPIGLSLYQHKVDAKVDDSVLSWYWDDGKEGKLFKKPTNDHLKNYTWLDGQPSLDFAETLGPMKFGYLTMSHSGTEIGASRYFNDVDAADEYSVKQRMSHIAQTKKHMKDRVCAEGDKTTCVPCIPKVVVCQRKVDNEKKNGKYTLEPAKTAFTPVDWKMIPFDEIKSKHTSGEKDGSDTGSENKMPPSDDDEDFEPNNREEETGMKPWVRNLLVIVIGTIFLVAVGIFLFKGDRSDKDEEKEKTDEASQKSVIENDKSTNAVDSEKSEAKDESGKSAAEPASELSAPKGEGEEAAIAGNDESGKDDSGMAAKEDAAKKDGEQAEQNGPSKIAQVAKMIQQQLTAKK